MDKAAALEYRKKDQGKSSLEKILTALIIALIFLLGAVAAYFLYTYASKRNAPPTGYFDYQLRIQRDNLRRNPKDPAAQTNVGYIYMKMGDNAKAVYYFDSALALEKDFVPALYNKGMYLKKIGDRAAAAKLLKHAGGKAVDGNKYIAYYSLGEMYYEDAKYDQALKYLDLANKDNATIWNALELRGKVYEKKKDTAKALENYKAAAAFNPTNAALQKKIKELINGQR